MSITCTSIIVLAATSFLLADAKTAKAAPATTQPVGRTSGEKVPVYVGTYTSGDSRGIYRFDLDTGAGTLTAGGLAAEVANPSFLAVHPNRRWLYAVGELSGESGIKAGAVHAFAIEARSGKLTAINSQAAGGRGPCHVSVHPQGRHVLVSSYGSGSVAVLPIDACGRLGEPTSMVQHTGVGADPKRQAGPRAHSMQTNATGDYAYVCDLGLDKIFIYPFDAARGMLMEKGARSAVLPPRSGPRHLALHPNGRFVYANNEMASSVSAFACATDGGLNRLQIITSVPDTFKGDNSTAEIAVHPSGRFLYCSNRGHDSIAAYAIDSSTGMLTAVGHTSTRGTKPRNFGIDPTGRWLVAANQGSNNLAVFSVDPDKGTLEPVGDTVACPIPVCVRFVP